MFLFVPLDYVLDQLVHTGELDEDCREKVRSALLQRHRHLNSKKEGQERKILVHIRYSAHTHTSAPNSAVWYYT